MTTPTSDATMAVFLDLENIALGARDAKYPSFDIEKVLERLLLKGHIVVKKAYCDFDRYKDFKRGLHEAAFELIEIPHVRQSGKNSTSDLFINNCDEFIYYDDLVRKEPSKARRRAAAPVRAPAASAASAASAETAPPDTAAPKGSDPGDAFVKVVETLEALIEERGEGESIWGSMIKQAIKRRHPGFNERFYGFRSFNDLLADA